METVCDKPTQVQAHLKFAHASQNKKSFKPTLKKLKNKT